MIVSPYFGSPYRNRNFGNQLFELASLVGLARRYETSLHLPQWRYAQYFKESSFIQRDLPESYISVKEKSFCCCLDFFDEQKESIQKEVVTIEGYLQSELYWKEVEEEVRALFSFEDKIINTAKSYLKNLQIDTKEFVAISVRRGDFETDPYHYLLPIEYYLGAKEKYFPNQSMMIFSDDIGWCKAHFGTDHEKVLFAENKTPIEQLALMSLFQNFIIANSTFSWWGAYLSGDKKKRVIRPWHHFDGVLKLKENICDHYPQEWIEYNYEIEHPRFHNNSQPIKNKPIPVYAINLKHRIDRRVHIAKQFEDKSEFNLSIVSAKEHEKGAFGLWKTVQQIVFEAATSDVEFFILCEDDHTFTDHYSYKLLAQCISKAQSMDAYLLSGGYSWFDHAVQISEHLFGVRTFNGMQFTIIFKRFYASILNAGFGEEVITDVFLSNITDRKFVIYPYISTQAEFGYSDVTNKNNESGYVDSIFTAAWNRLAVLNKVAKHYGIRDFSPKEIICQELEGISIPTYIINLKERPDRLAHALSQFEGKPEFELQVTEACHHEIGAVGLWNSIVKIVSQVIESEDDVIILCEDDHTFTEHYHKNTLIHHIIEAANQGTDLLSGGIGGFGNAFSVSPNRYWVDWLWCTQFMILYRPIFQKILNYEFKETDTADGVLSELTSRKMVIYPFISTQQDFGYSDVTRSNNEISGKITLHFYEANAKMGIYHNMIQKIGDWILKIEPKADAEKL